MRKSYNLAFTLIEILVVIVIIGILAALIGGVAINATASASRTACLNNLRQIGAGLSIYVQRNDYHLPYCTMRPSTPPVGEEFFPGITKTLIPDCGGNKLIFRCPDDPECKFYLLEQSSYEWQSSFVNGKPLNQKSLKLLGVDRFIMMDYDNFHKAGDESEKNYLYADGRALPQPEF